MQVTYRINVFYYWNPDPTAHVADITLALHTNWTDGVPEAFWSLQSVMSESIDADWGSLNDDGDERTKCLQMEEDSFPELHAAIEAKVANLQAQLNAIVQDANPTAVFRKSWGPDRHVNIDID